MFFFGGSVLCPSRKLLSNGINFNPGVISTLRYTKPTMDKKLVRFDWAIKYLLRNKANFVILEGFLSELLKTEVTITSLLESESNKADADDKSNRIDVFAVLSGGEKVIIEVQCIRNGTI